MGIMSFLRNRMGLILVIFIAFALFAFIAMDVVRYGRSFFSGDNNLVGEVAGEKITIEDFNNTVERNSAQFKQQSGQGNISPQITTYIQGNTWNEYLSKLIIKKEVEKIGLDVGEDETGAMTTGNNPDPQIVQSFTDPKTGQFSRANLISTIQNIAALKADDPEKKRWGQFIEDLIQAKLAEKYMALATNGLYVNSLDAKDDYEARNKIVNFKYTSLDYASVPDSKITLTDADYSDYYDAHKKEFDNQQELRNIDYVSFNAAPSKDDSVTIKEQISKLEPAFKASTNDSLFVQINSETKAPLVYQHKGKLDPAIDSIMYNAKPGFTYGPYLSNGSYNIAKLVDSRISPDSVKARHILIDPNAVGGMDKAIARADSLKKLIEAGKSFADLANF
jgi:peptidyl-prolyl cis-trans isomerase D